MHDKQPEGYPNQVAALVQQLKALCDRLLHHYLQAICRIRYTSTGRGLRL